MNEADSPSINLDELRLLPDWLREEALPPSKQYAGHDGRSDERGGSGDRRGGGRPPFGGPRGGGGGGSRGAAGGQRDQRSSGGGGQARGGDARRDRPRPGSGSGPQGGGGGRFDRRDQRGSGPSQATVAPVTPAPVQIDFMPESRCLAGIVKQIRSTHMAYPLFGTARMFLQEPERHLLKVTVVPAASEGGVLLYQLGEDGPIALDRQVLERIAYEAMKDRFYVEQTVTKDPPKGNFTNVARCRLSGTILGPTNYHGYQPALRSLYESRFSRRMPFEEFRQSIEVVNDPALLEKWKEEASTATTISTREGEPPTVFQSNAEARLHFRQFHLETLLQAGNSFQLPGSVARSLPEAGMMMAIRQSNENELRYPAQFVQYLRKGLQDAGLHIFKHRKRIVYVAVTRPVPFSGGAVSENVAAILEFVGEKPLCTRKDLANKFLPRYTQSAPVDAPSPVAAPVEDTTAPLEGVEPAPEASTQQPQVSDPLIKAKAALAADLRFLVQAGHIIEFHNGTFDLPLSAKTKEEPTGRSLPKPNPLFVGDRKGQSKPGNTPMHPETPVVTGEIASAVVVGSEAMETPSVSEPADESAEVLPDLSSSSEASEVPISEAPEPQPSDSDQTEVVYGDTVTEGGNEVIGVPQKSEEPASDLAAQESPTASVENEHVESAKSKSAPETSPDVEAPAPAEEPIPPVTAAQGEGPAYVANPHPE